MASAGLTCGMLRGARALTCLTSPPESVYSVLVAGTANAKGGSVGNEFQLFKHGEARGDSSASLGAGSVGTAADGKFASVDTDCVPSSPIDLQLMLWSNGDLQEQVKVTIQPQSESGPGSVDWIGQNIAVALDSGYAIAHIRESDMELVNQTTMLEHSGFRAARFSRHDEPILAVSSAGKIFFTDTRTPSDDKNAPAVECHRSGLVNDMDFSPVRRKMLVAAYTDGFIRTWDLRSPAAPLSEMKAHNNWACCVRYNPLHDGLLLSSGSDGVVQLWKDVNTVPVHGIAHQPVETFPDHDTSVYGLVWESADEFSFASVSYDGRVRVNQVPETIKNQVLLE